MTPVVCEERLFNFAPWHSSLETITMRVSAGDKVEEKVVPFLWYVTVTGTTRRTMDTAMRQQQQIPGPELLPPKPLGTPELDWRKPR